MESTNEKIKKGIDEKGEKEKKDTFGRMTREKMATNRMKSLPKDELIKQKRKKISLQSSINTWSMIKPKLEEWENILDQAGRGLRVKKQYLSKIQEKIEKIFEIVFKLHGRTDYADEVINLCYHNYLRGRGVLRNSEPAPTF